ncbi:MAG TPA: thioesterase family protein [Acidimicrobiia bacterium]|nr:thioesterase family protein [Acidimicrobiia bacterium]
MEAEPIYEVEAGRFVPTEHAAGPWDPAYLHGGAVSGLLAREVEVRGDVAFDLVRLTVELVRPVPRVPLTVDLEEASASKSVRRLAVTVATADGVVATGTALLVRHADLDHGATGADDRLEAGADVGEPTRFPHEPADGGGAFHRTGMELRFVQGGFDQPGPGTTWFRFRRPLVAGDTPTALQTVAAAADFGNGISWALPADRWVFINPDLTIHLARPPATAWIGMAAVTIASPVGWGMAESAIYDEGGRVGRSVQSLFVDRRR